MKVIICLASFVAVASASHLVAPAAVVPAAINTGSSSQYRSQDNLGQYSFGYDEAGATGGSFRHEKSDVYGNRVGSYGLTGADGRVRVVNYVADGNGYRASVQTNEPGTESRDSAAVAVNRGPVAFAAPLLAAAPALPAPIYAPAPVAAAPLPVAAAAPLPAPLAAAPLPLPAPVLAGPVPLPAPLLAHPAPLALPAPAVFSPAGFGFSIVNQHLAPLPAY